MPAERSHNHLSPFPSISLCKMPPRSIKAFLLEPTALEYVSHIKMEMCVRSAGGGGGGVGGEKKVALSTTVRYDVPRCSSSRKRRSWWISFTFSCVQQMNKIKFKNVISEQFIVELISLLQHSCTSIFL
jgi:hypothetical protein